jgi:hypothetical protein
MMIMAMPVMAMIMVMARVIAIFALRVIVMVVAFMSVPMPMMIVAVVIVAMSRVIMTMIVRFGRIGAAFRIERGLDLPDSRAAFARQILDDGIAADAQLLPDDLYRQMPIAEMIGQTHDLARIRAGDLDEFLGQSEHFDETSVLQHQSVAAAQSRRLRQVDQEFEAACSLHRDVPAMARLGVEHDDIGGLSHPTAVRLHRNRSNHRRFPRIARQFVLERIREKLQTFPTRTR